MAIPTEEDVFIDTLGAPMRELVAGMYPGNVKVLREKDGTPRAVAIDAETYEQLVRPQTDGPSPFSVDDVIQALESELKDLGGLSPYELGQLLLLADAQRGIEDALAGRVTSATEFRQELRERAKRREEARSKDEESGE